MSENTRPGWFSPHWMQHGLDALKALLGDQAQQREFVQLMFDLGFWHADKLTWDGACIRMRDCANPGKSAHFRLSELWAMMRASGRHHLFLAMADDLGYEVRLRSTDERRTYAMERLAAALEENNHLAQLAKGLLAGVDMDLARDAKPPRLHPAIHGGGNFDLGPELSAPLPGGEDEDDAPFGHPEAI